MDKSIRKMQIREFLKDKMLRTFMILLVILSIFPFLYMFLISIMDTISMRLTWDVLKNATYTIENYKKLFFNGGNFGRYILNSTIITLYIVIVAIVVSSMAAYVFAKKRFVGSAFIYRLYVATMMVPSQAILIPLFIIVKELGLLNTYSGIALPLYYAYGVVMLRSFMKNIPTELFEAADLDGCGEVRKFLTVVIPLIKPALISLAIYFFFNVWGNLIWPMLVASNDKMTITQAVASMQSGIAVTHYGSMMAAATVAFLPPFILYMLMQKQFVEGIAVSGLKG